VPFARAICVATGDAEPRPHLAVNLSRGGLFVLADEAPACGARVRLELAAAGRYLDFADGEVAWVRARRPKGFGVRFTHLRPNAQALVEHLVARGGTGTPNPRPRRRMVAGVLVAAVSLAGGVHHLRATRPERPVSPPEPPAVSEPPPVSTAKPYPGEFQLAVPTGAVTSLRVTVDENEVAVTPTLRRGTAIRNVFTLPHPARLVIDVNGRQPKYSWQLDGSTVVKSVRVGARNHGTRIVVDLPDERPGRVVIPTS
jgi:hypothetical protein